MRYAAGKIMGSYQPPWYKVHHLWSRIAWHPLEGEARVSQWKMQNKPRGIT